MSGQLMQRPVMDPLFLTTLQSPPKRRQVWARAAADAARWVAGKLLSHPLRFRRSRLKFQRETWGWRAVRGVAYRLLFAPILLSLVACALVFAGTHPRPVAANGDPGSVGVYYDPVDLASEHDNHRLSGWLVPVVDARRVLLHKDRLFTQQHPAVVLVHDFGQNPQQMLPLIAPLHEEGIVVLTIGLRGVGTTETRSQTFGLHEAGDVLAAVNLLKARPFVDPSRVAVVGLGTGANAAVLAMQKDPSIAALVLADPVESAADVLGGRLGPDVWGLRWMQPITRWAFELAYHRNLDDVSLNQHQSTLGGRQVLRVTGATNGDVLTTARTEQIRGYLRDALKPWGKR